MKGLTHGRPSKKVNNETKLEDVKSDAKVMTKVNFNLDKDRHYALKKYALENDKTVTDVLIEMIDEKVHDR